MIIAENIQILETSLCPPCCKKETVEKFIAALQYKNFLEKEQKKLDSEIKQLCMLIEDQMIHNRDPWERNTYIVVLGKILSVYLW